MRVQLQSLQPEHGHWGDDSRDRHAMVSDERENPTSRRVRSHDDGPTHVHDSQPAGGTHRQIVGGRQGTQIHRPRGQGLSD